MTGGKAVGPVTAIPWVTGIQARSGAALGATGVEASPPGPHGDFFVLRPDRDLSLIHI